MSKKKKVSKAEKSKLLLIIPIVVLVLILGAVVVVAIKGDGFKKKSSKTSPYTEDQMVTEKWQEGIINYKGKYYKYNNRIDTYLLMGVDRAGVVEQVDDYTDGGQTDAIFLLVVDKANEEFSVISVNRNTITDVEEYNSEGIYVGTYPVQICTQHLYGDGKRLSCRRTANAISNMFDNLPIEGYLSLQVDALPILNDAIGGVEVEVLHDIKYPVAGVDLTEGETVNLNGSEAYYYLRGRDVTEAYSADYRLKRQEQYINAYLAKVNKLPDKRNTLKGLYEDLEDYIVSNIDFVEMLSSFSEYGLTKDHIYTVPGETTIGEEYEEFHIDEDGLYDLIIDVFYNEVEAPEE